MKNIAGDVVEQIVCKIDEKNNKNSQETDSSVLPADKLEESVALEHDVLVHDDVKTDEPLVEQCPVHGTITSNVVETVDTAAGTVFDSGQPPGYVKEVETVSPPVYVNNDTVDTGEKHEKISDVHNWMKVYHLHLMLLMREIWKIQF